MWFIKRSERFKLEKIYNRWGPITCLGFNSNKSWAGEIISYLLRWSPCTSSPLLLPLFKERPGFKIHINHRQEKSFPAKTRVLRWSLLDLHFTFTLFTERDGLKIKQTGPNFSIRTIRSKETNQITISFLSEINSAADTITARQNCYGFHHFRVFL